MLIDIQLQQTVVRRRNICCGCDFCVRKTKKSMKTYKSSLQKVITIINISNLNYDRFLTRFISLHIVQHGKELKLEPFTRVNIIRQVA